MLVIIALGRAQRHSGRCSSTIAAKCPAQAGIVMSAQDHGALLEARGIDKQLRRACGGKRHQFPARRRSPPRADRPERRRQNHLHQSAHRRAGADRGQGVCSTATISREWRNRARQAGYRAHVPDQPFVPRSVGAGKCLYPGLRAARCGAAHVQTGRPAQGRRSTRR